MKLIFSAIVLLSLQSQAQVKITPVKGVSVQIPIKTGSTQIVPENTVFNLDVKDSSYYMKNAKLTTNKAIYKGITYPVYVTDKNSKMFIIIRKEDGITLYRKYIN